MNPLQELTQKIHKDCPELLELSFGCRVQEKDEAGNLYSLGTVVAVHYGDIFQVSFPMDGSVDVVRRSVLEDEENYEILGHPITLEHVLRAIEKSGRVIAARGDGVFMLYDEGTGYQWRAHATHLGWTLTKPLSEQSEDTINWLNEIIV